MDIFICSPIDPAFDKFPAVRESLDRVKAGSNAEEAGLREGWRQEIMNPQ